MEDSYPALEAHSQVTARRWGCVGPPPYCSDTINESFTSPTQLSYVDLASLDRKQTVERLRHRLIVSTDTITICRVWGCRALTRPLIRLRWQKSLLGEFIDCYRSLVMKSHTYGLYHAVVVFFPFISARKCWRKLQHECIIHAYTLIGCYSVRNVLIEQKRDSRTPIPKDRKHTRKSFYGTWRRKEISVV